MNAKIGELETAQQGQLQAEEASNRNKIERQFLESLLGDQKTIISELKSQFATAAQRDREQLQEALKISEELSAKM